VALEDAMKRESVAIWLLIVATAFGACATEVVGP